MNKMMLLVSCIVLSLLAVSAFAGDGSWDKVKKDGKLVIGLDDSFPPMGYRQADGKRSQIHNVLPRCARGA